jgi:hypothetical protein
MGFNSASKGLKSMLNKTTNEAVAKALDGRIKMEEL